MQFRTTQKGAFLDSSAFTLIFAFRLPNRVFSVYIEYDTPGKFQQFEIMSGSRSSMISPIHAISFNDIRKGIFDSTYTSKV